MQRGLGSQPRCAYPCRPCPAPAQIGGEPIRIIFPFAAGGSGDALARLIAEHLRVALDQPVIVENRAGAQGRIGVQAVKAAAPDGKTLLLTPVAPMSVYQHVYKALAYDPDRRFPAGVAGRDLRFRHRGGSAGAGEVAQGAGRLGEGQPGAGQLRHARRRHAAAFLRRQFARAAGLDLRHVGYRGSAAALTDLVGGQIPIVVTTTSDLLEQHKAGRIRVLATSDRQRSPFLPDMPTFKEAGYDIRARGWYGVFVPAKTPADVVERLNKAIVAAVQTPVVKERLLAFGLRADRHVGGGAGRSRRRIPSCGRPPSRPRASRRSNEGGPQDHEAPRITRAAIAETYERIRPHIRRTPVLAVEARGLRPRRRRAGR